MCADPYTFFGADSNPSAVGLWTRALSSITPYFSLSLFESLCHFSAAWPEGRSAWFRITLFPDPTLSDPTINFANPKFILQFSFLDPLTSFLSKAQKRLD
jgi:hypothetical protein